VKTYVKQILFLVLGISLSTQALALNLEKLNVAPKLSKELAKGKFKSELKELENETGYIAAKPIKRIPPKYPFNQQKKAQGGIVEIEFMVDREGKVFEPIVTNSTHPGFEENAVDAVKKYQFEPATLDGNPIISSDSMRMFFEIEGTNEGAGSTFIKLYKRTNQELDKEVVNQKKVRRNLERMANARYINNYSLGFLYIQKFRYAAKFLTKEEQLDSLQNLLLFSENKNHKKEFIDAKTTTTFRMNILQLLIQLGYYGKAHNDYYWLKKELPHAAKPFEKAMKLIYEKLNSNEGIARNISIDERGYEFLHLAKRSIEFNDIKGNIKKLNLRCTRNFASIEFNPENNYQIPKSWGSCNLEVVGEPGTSAVLAQY